MVGSREPEKLPIRSATPAKPSHLPFNLQNSSVPFHWHSPSLSSFSPICFSLFALKHISQCSRGMSMSQLSLSLPPLPSCFDCLCRDSNFSSTAASPGPSAGLPLPDRPLWLVALSSLFVPMLFLLSLLDLQAQMPASSERFTRSLVPSSTVCNTFFYAFYPESWHWRWRWLWQAALLSLRKIFSTTITN